MKMSVREARANFAHALDAAERGEQVLITRNGKTVAELGPPKAKKIGFDFEHNEAVRKKLGLDKYDHLPRDEKWLEDFDDDAASREFWGIYFDRSDKDVSPA
ncbi:type II toxin-antitoxin system Phd/YefM family antitoxin [Sphingomonas qilianensis]|uniref:Antitoxin n=1 Tax=Sphingomonas qilianensis TaxID=1736690 RepID=A0ABU9XSL0_9SPHN